MVQEKHTIETFAQKYNLARQSALNLLCKLKKQGLVAVSGGGRQKRIYTLNKLPKKKTNGFYDVVNKYSPQKLQPAFEHYVNGPYTVEHAIIDGIKIGDVRTLEATTHLFRHVQSWKRLFDLAKKAKVKSDMLSLYGKAKATVKCRKMPRRYAP